MEPNYPDPKEPIFPEEPNITPPEPDIPETSPYPLEEDPEPYPSIEPTDPWPEPE